MPLVLFENVSPSASRSVRVQRAAMVSHSLILLSLTIWAVVAVALLSATTWLVRFLGRAVAPQLAGSLALLLLFIAGLALAGVVLTLAVGIFNFSMFSLLITHLYLRIGKPQLSTSTMAKYASLGPRRFSLALLRE